MVYLKLNGGKFGRIMCVIYGCGYKYKLIEINKIKIINMNRVW